MLRFKNNGITWTLAHNPIYDGPIENYINNKWEYMSETMCNDCCEKQPVCEGNSLTKTKQKMNYSVEIRELDRGYTVHVGCKSFVVIDKDELISLLTMYINEPYTTEEKFYNGELFK